MATLPDSLGPEQLRPLRRVEYERLVAEGCFDDERIELLAGWLVAMSPSSAAHAWVVQTLDERLRAVGEAATVRAQLPLALSADSEPEPDLAVVPPGDYRARHPDHALLVVEVADTSLAKDRGPKAELYASAGVPEYWIVNLVDRVVEVHTEPGKHGYGARHVLTAGDDATSQVFPGLRLPVSELLP